MLTTFSSFYFVQNVSQILFLVNMADDIFIGMLLIYLMSARKGYLCIACLYIIVLKYVRNVFIGICVHWGYLFTKILLDMLIWNFQIWNFQTCLSMYILINRIKVSCLFHSKINLASLYINTSTSHITIKMLFLSTKNNMLILLL